MAFWNASTRNCGVSMCWSTRVIVSAAGEPGTSPLGVGPLNVGDAPLLQAPTTRVAASSIAPARILIVTVFSSGLP